MLFTDETPFAAKAPEKPTFPPRSLFSDAGIYIGRSFDDEAKRLGVAFKAGHNAEQHNHNDVGSYVVAFNKNFYVVDPGSEIYTRRTFSAQRYESQMLNSFGHSVPVVAGQLQQTGREASGRFVKTDFTDGMDTIVCDMTKAYAQVKELRNLLRTIRFDRAKKRLSVRDEVEFTSPQDFATAVITYQTIRQIDERNLAIYNGDGGVRVAVSSEGGETAVDIGEVVNENSKNPKRIGIAMTQPVLKGAITVEIDILPESFERIGFYQAPDEADFKPQTERAIMVEAESFSTQEGGEVIVMDKVDASGQAFKMWDNKGHRLGWNVDVPQDGVYAIQLRMANGNIYNEGLRNVAVDGALLHPAETPLRLPITSGWANDKAEDWRVVWLAKDGKAILTPLAKGRHVLTMENADGHGIVLDWIRLVPVK
jgi:hypothetical protein